MPSTETIGIIAILGAFVLGPPLSIISLSQIRRHFPVLLKPVLIMAVVIIAIVASCKISGIGWLSDLMNVLSVAIAYLAYCLIFGIVWTKNRSAARSKLIKVAAAPIILGYFLGTIGGLGVAWAMSEKLGLTQSEISPVPGLLCREKASDEFHDVIVYRYSPFLPFIGREERRVAVDETKQEDGLTRDRCEIAARGLY